MPRPATIPDCHVRTRLYRDGYRAAIWPERGGFAWELTGFRAASGWEPNALLAGYALETAMDVAEEVYD